MYYELGVDRCGPQPIARQRRRAVSSSFSWQRVVKDVSQAQRSCSAWRSAHNSASNQPCTTDQEQHQSNPEQPLEESSASILYTLPCLVRWHKRSNSSHDQSAGQHVQRYRSFKLKQQAGPRTHCAQQLSILRSAVTVQIRWKFLLCNVQCI